VSQQLLHGIFFHPVQLQVAVFLVSFQDPLAFQVSGYPQTDLVDQLAQFALLRGLGSPKYDFPVLVPAVDTVEKQHVEVNRAAFGFRFSALPKRWTRVTAPAMPFFRVKPAFFNRAPEMTR
jgi:hypothetical protein